MIFDACHIYLFSILSSPIIQSQDLALKFWVLARLTEVIALYLMSLDISIIKVNRWTNLIVTTTFAVGISLALISYPKAISPFYTEYGFTWVHKAAETLIILLIIMSLLKVKRRLRTI